MMQRATSSYQTTLFYLISMIMSILFSWLAIKQHAVINPDGICYVLSAEQFKGAGLKAVMQTCGQANWPFYSVLLAITTAISTLSLEQSAFFLNAIFDAMTVLFFVMIVQRLNANPRIVLLGLFTILCAHDFNSVRDIIVRDHGYWMCYLASLYCLLRYVERSTLFWASAFGLSMVVATLFRIEGLVFFFLLPLSVLACKGYMRERLQRMGKLYLPHILIAVSVLVLLFLFKDGLYEYSGRLPGALNKILYGALLILTQFQTAKMNLLHHVLPIEAARDATLVMLLLLVVWYVITAVSQFSLLYSGLLLYFCGKRIRIANDSAKVVLIAYFVINLLITVSFFAMHFFLSKRYLMAQSFILMLLIPFALNELINKARNIYRKSVLVLIFMAMILMNSHLFYARPDAHQYLGDAGRWVKEFVPVTQSFYTNDEFVLYYSGRSRSEFFHAMTRYNTVERLTAYDYLAINTKRPNANKLLEQVHATKAVLARHFDNQKHEQILIYNMHLKEGQLT